MTNDEQTPKTEYFVLRDSGYDGISIEKVGTREKAEKQYEEIRAEVKRWVKKYGEKDADKGIALIEGRILKSEDIEF